MTRRSRSTPESPGRHPFPEDVVVSLETELKARISRRDRVAEMARTLRRASQDLMRRVHASSQADPRSRAELSPRLQELSSLAQKLSEELDGDGWREENVAADALQEWVEVNLLVALVTGRPAPSPSDLTVKADHYLLGLSDLVGEVRRLAVSALGGGDLDAAVANLHLMEELLAVLMRFDLPRSLAPMKPKQDTARSLIEKTRGEVEMARYLDRFARGHGKRSRRAGA